eukprot:TRINITY_DN4707_c0_g1_i1.p1 TRINITY_DN4707_c0_g1~~TRINITY_DN4707_c0_g1_i1.p1  ORF type:complete len:332 (-),score=64.89 TRINITY_DN4707_c0_g1_i1:77-1072(-)
MEEAQQKIFSFMFSSHILQCVRVICKYKIPDLIHSGKKTSKELAEATGLHEETLFRITRATSLVGAVKYDNEIKTFELDAGGQYLRTDHPASMWGMVMFLSLPVRLECHAKLEETAKTGINSCQLATGGDFFTYGTKHPESLSIMNLAMSQFAAGKIHDYMANVVPLDGVKVIMDVGGGVGTLAHRILERTPTIEKAICFDLPEVVKESPLKDDRLELVGGNFFKPETFPKGADAAVVATVLHDWSDEESITIMKNTRSALPEGGKFFISENIISNTPSPVLALDIEMLLMVTGRERTLQEFNDMASKASFKFVKLHQSPAAASVIEYVAI